MSACTWGGVGHWRCWNPARAAGPDSDRPTWWSHFSTGRTVPREPRRRRPVPNHATNRTNPRRRPPTCWPRSRLAAHVTAVPPVLYLLGAGGADAGPCVLPGKGPSPDGAVSTTWSNLVLSQRGLPAPSPVLAHCAAQFLAALVARLEETTGCRSVPCDTVTVSVDGAGSLDFYGAVARACAREFGVRPTFLWPRRRAAGWAVSSAGVLRPPRRRRRRGGRGAVGRRRPPPYWPASRTARSGPPSIPGLGRGRSNRPTARTTGVTHLRAVVTPGPAGMVRERCAALGAAQWGWWRTAAHRPHADRTLGAWFGLVGNEEPDPQAGPAAEAEEEGADAPAGAAAAPVGARRLLRPTRLGRTRRTFTWRT